MKIDLENKKIFFAVLIIIAAAAVFFRFWNLTSNDLYSDDSLYSFRALGWFDYLGGGQTTPIQWFDSVPGWARLSFHDAPPLVFLIQNIFFKIFGPNALAARLPFALAGLGTIVLLYFSVKRFKDKSVALIAAFLLGVSSFAVWLSRVGYLEGVEVFFIVLSVFFFARYLKEEKKADLCFWSAAVGLAILCKYTAIFLLPAVVLYLLFWKRKVFFKKEFWLALVLFFVVLTPIIAYNFQVFQTRGHFDAALSSMVGMHPEDFKAISSRGLSADYWQNFLNIIITLFEADSLLVFLLILISFIYLLVKNLCKRGDSLEKFLLMNIAMVSVMFLFSGTGQRFVAIMMPFFLVILAVSIVDLWQFLEKKEYKVIQAIMLGSLVVVLGWELFYNANTNLLKQPVVSSPLAYSSYRFYNLGFNQLDDYLQDKVINGLLWSKKISKLDDLNFNLSDFKGKEVIFFDESISWFAGLWYLQKYPIYYNIPVISFLNYLRIVPAGSNDTFALLKQNNITGFYYIYAVDRKVLDPVKEQNLDVMKNMKLLADQLEKYNIAFEEIKNSRGRTVFKVYHVKF